MEKCHVCNYQTNHSALIETHFNQKDLFKVWNIWTWECEIRSSVTLALVSLIVHNENSGCYNISAVKYEKYKVQC